MIALSILNVLIAMAASPLLFGIINRVKAKVAGRRGQPVLQLYYDLWKLLQKGSVYSRTTTWIFRAGPIVSLAAAGGVLLVVPLGSVSAAVMFPGDLILAAYLLGLIRFMTVLAAMDTGSAFEGMGASREVQFAAMAEPAMLMGLGALAALTGNVSLSGIIHALPAAAAPSAIVTLILVASATFIVLLAENSRIPFDDPNTHLELTMIHEVMVLDHGGIELAAIEYGAALKLWAYAAIFSGIAFPARTGFAAADALVTLAGIFVAAAAVGFVESAMARLRLLRVPQLLLAASVLSLLGLVLVLR